MDAGWFHQARFEILRHNISFAGVVAFVVCTGAGLGLSSFLQSDAVRRLLARLGIHKNFAGIVTSVLGLAVFINLLVVGIELGGIPIPWSKPVPGINLSALQAITLIFWAMVAIWFSSASRSFVFNRFLSQSGLDRSLQYALAQVTGYVALALGLFIALQSAGIGLSGLTVFAGALGVGLGLGLQAVAANFISGLVILAERPIKIGDRITVDGVAGQVQSIRVRATTVVTNDNIAMIIPNSKLIGNTVTNWSYGSPSVRFHIPVVVVSGSDVAKVCKTLIAAAKEHPAVLADPEPVVYLMNFADHHLNFELIVWSEEMSYHPDRFRSDLNFAIEQKLREAGI